MSARFAFLLVLLMLLTRSTAFCDTGNIRIWVGKKALDESDWTGLDRQTEIGLLTNWSPDLPVRLAADLLYSTDSVTTEDSVNPSGTLKTTATTVEVDLGARKNWGKRVSPYLGGGLALIYPRVESRNSDCDTSPGFWVNAGLDFRISKLISLGLDVRLSRAKITLFDGYAGDGIDAEGGGEHFGLTLGFDF